MQSQTLKCVNLDEEGYYYFTQKPGVNKAMKF
jgi:hypothetical protein